jgi:RNA polymerase sigma factor (sigma-70 family)
MVIASEQLWETFSRPLHQFIQRWVSDPHSAEDILQDVFLKIHTHIDTLRTQDRLTSWIYQITRNAIADYYRAQRPTVELDETLPATDELLDDDMVRELSPCVAAMVAARGLPRGAASDRVSGSVAEGVERAAGDLFLGCEVTSTARPREDQRATPRVLSLSVRPRWPDHRLSIAPRLLCK